MHANRPALAPGGLPLLGHLPALLSRPLAFLDTLPAHGDLVRIRVGPREMYVASGPEAVRRVLTDRTGYDRTGPLYGKIRAFLGNGLASCPHADHPRLRRIVQPAFRPGLLPHYAGAMTAETAALLAGWRPGRAVDVTREAFRLTTAVAVRTLFSAGLEPPAAEALRAALDVLLRGIYLRVVLPAADLLPTPARRNYRRALATWRSGVAAIIADHRARGIDRGDVLALLLAARDEHGRPLAEDELADQVATLVLAGAETTSSALAWSLRLVAEHPEVERKLHAEVDAVLPDGRPAEWSDLPRLPYAARVIDEALRLYPPAWAISRTTTRPVELDGAELPAGALVVCCLYLLQRRPELFPRPQEFDPDRFADGGMPRGGYLPFGFGATKCLGDRFGLAEAVLALATVAARWRLRPAAPGPVRPVPRLVLSPGPQPMLPRARR
ncbi:MULTISPECIES: cytochrome P450 [Kitasatospora]|uniref:Putative cytochrome P450 n=1 Tax=Kitasatospora setae (strain ATCC 33774 / DSM 43861 / JCM 3304 / KCC A-0304 / NBRC 14216 / KM-6054) TaxID=452652 RepID=E4N8U7_KITSK|nr:cytochrome P450 [Kitasatospora setae]BAJ27628.1 putative cytochrome P450 [Kitasatospora setae KM-6054]